MLGVGGGDPVRLVCRFHFPKQTMEATSLGFKYLNNGQFLIQLAMQRNDPLLSDHNRVAITRFRSNMDMQLALNVEAVKMYLVKYMVRALHSFAVPSLVTNVERDYVDVWMFRSNLRSLPLWRTESSRQAASSAKRISFVVPSRRP